MFTVGQLAPHLDLEAEAGPRFDRDTWAEVKAQRASDRSRSRKQGKTPTSSLTTPTDSTGLRPPGHYSVPSAPTSETEASRSQELGDLVEDLERGLKRMAIGPAEYRYHGKVR